MDDDLTRIGALLAPERSPSLVVTEQARRRLLEVAGRRRPSLPRLRGLPGRLIVAVGTAAGLVAAGFGFHAWETRPLYRPEPLAGQDGPAASFLLAAADGKARHSTSGRFWYVHTVRGTTSVVKSPRRPNVRYTVEVSRDAYELAGEGGGDDWDGDEIKVRPAGPSDKAEWTADWAPDASELGVEPPVEQELTPGTDEGAMFDIGVPEVAQLPADPSELRAWILNYATKFDHKRLHDPDLYLFVNAPIIITDLPVPDRLRIATYRILASLKNVRMVDATDAEGRRGRAVAMRQTSRDYGTIEWQLFIDPSTGRLTARQGVLVTPGRKNAGLRPGTRQYFELVKTADWSNASRQQLAPRWVWDKSWEPPEPPDE
ncbi:CU044_5270 family protein [Actinomadura barringtoniae]|uniref:CU044_5270 family protein n=1 Tax=Actinomadura barringtoniae TaxID=1427535 RepID=A0A939T5B7_9ACTN|nr:CU044_5270 family protein [Actinomadura barringtoniae]MBO2446917.1 CU044_5270 family protein [Actinomadura barringtoniae]